MFLYANKESYFRKVAEIYVLEKWKIVYVKLVGEEGEFIPFRKTYVA